MAPGPYTRINKNSEIEFDEFVYYPAHDEDEDTKPHYRYYKSEKILGKLYRAVDERKIWHEDVKLKGNEGSFWDGFIEMATKRCRAVGWINWRHQAESAEYIKET